MYSYLYATKNQKKPKKPPKKTKKKTLSLACPSFLNIPSNHFSFSYSLLTSSQNKLLHISKASNRLLRKKENLTSVSSYPHILISSFIMSDLGYVPSFAYHPYYLETFESTRLTWISTSDAKISAIRPRKSSPPTPRNLFWTRPKKALPIQVNHIHTLLPNFPLTIFR